MDHTAVRKIYNTKSVPNVKNNVIIVGIPSGTINGDVFNKQQHNTNSQQRNAFGLLDKIRLNNHFS